MKGTGLRKKYLRILAKLIGNNCQLKNDADLQHTQGRATGISLGIYVQIPKNRLHMFFI